METTRFAKSYLYAAQLGSINIQMLRPLRTSTSEKQDNFFILGGIKNIQTKQHSHFHGNFRIALSLNLIPFHNCVHGNLPVEAEDSNICTVLMPLKCE